MRTWMRWMAVAAAAAGLGLVGPAVAGAAGAADSCAVTWGSLDTQATSAGSGSSASLTNVRAGRHDCYDRIVLDIAGDGAAQVRYVASVPYEGRDGSIPLRGGAFLQVLTGPSYDVDTGAATFSPANPNELVDVNGWSTLRQLADGGSFEGQTTLGVGVRARLPFRVFGLSGPGTGSRLIIDVANHW